MPFAVLLLVICYLSPVFASESLEINVREQKINVPYWPSLPFLPSKGGVVIVQGGVPAYGTESLRKLGELLAKRGWSVILLAGDDPRNVAPWLEQLPEALAAIRQKASGRLVLIHYGDEFAKTLAYFTQPQAKQVTGLVLLSAFQFPHEEQPEIDLAKTIKKIRFPVFEIAGQFDYAGVLAQAEKHQFIFPAQTYRLMLLPGAGHDYGYCRHLLAGYLNGWMSNLQTIKPALGALQL